MTDVATVANQGAKPVASGKGAGAPAGAATALDGAFAALLGVFEPILAPIWVWLVHGEIPSQRTVIGGSIVFADGKQTTLQSRDENGSSCKWRVTVPDGTAAGTANVQISVVKDSRETKLSGTIDIESAG